MNDRDLPKYGNKLYVYGSGTPCCAEANRWSCYFAKPAIDGRERGAGFDDVRAAVVRARSLGYELIWDKDPSGNACALDDSDRRKLCT